MPDFLRSPRFLARVLRRSLRAAAIGAVVCLAGGLLVQACQDELAMAPIAGELAAVALRNLKVTGGGTGGGVVTAPNVGGAGALECRITAATFDPIECTKAYPRNTVVQLTAKPDPGSTLKEWRGSCTGKAPTCTVRMDVNRPVRVVFQGQAKPSFQLNVVGGGTGGGTVSTQAGISPTINCIISAGAPPSGECSRSYPSGTSVILTAAATSGHTFDGWSGDCTGTGDCTLTLSANRAVTANFSIPQGPDAVFGRWAPPQSNPVIGIHLSLLPNGNALTWGHAGEPQLLNPLGGFTQVANHTCTDPAICELFCSGHTFLADGRLLVAGGHNEALGDNNGITQASVFDGTAWHATGSMTYGRWYPTLVTLENGDVLALSGSRTPSLNATIPERWSGGSWTALTGANFSVPLYPRAFVEPKNGHVFVAGPSSVRILNPSGAGSWSPGPPRQVSSTRNYGSAVMVDSKVLYAGGGGNNCPSLPESSAEIIDLADPAPAWRTTGSMAFRRRQNNLTILADGKVLVTGGTSTCGFSDESGPVFAAEQWDPETGQWTTLASASVVRVYHSTTALLPDGRVLSTGSGGGGGVTWQLSYEIFSPPYLFKGPRPSYNLTATDMHYGQPFTVSTPDAATIRKVNLIRHASSTHAFDMGQRLNTLTFEPAADGQSLTVTPPSAGRIAPPGPYHLFLVNDQGVPSVAQTVLLTP